MKNQSGFLRLLLLVVVLFLAACGGDGNAGNDNAAQTVEALRAEIAGTATAAAFVPTATIQPTTEASATLPPDEQATAVRLEATQEALDQAATKEAEAAAADQAAIDAQATLVPIQAELAQYGIGPNEGQLGWVHPPAQINVEGYMGYTYTNQFIATVAQDFVVAADITWNTQYGTTGCGFVVRSDGNEDALDQYVIIATRGANGRVIFVVQEDGQTIRNEIVDIYANAIDPLFEWQNDTTNRLVVVGRGNTFTIYTNGTKIGDITPSDAFIYEKGFVVFVALNESGYTNCGFTNSWLWLLN